MNSNVRSMAGRRVTLTLDEWTYEAAGVVAARAGMSTSAWMSAAVRHEAVRQGVGPNRATPEELEAQALADDAELAAAEAHLRAEG